MTTDAKITYAEAEAYLNKHEIRKLFEELTAILIYKRPEKPLQFLQKVLQLKIEQGVIPTPKGKVCALSSIELLSSLELLMVRLHQQKSNQTHLVLLFQPVRLDHLQTKILYAVTFCCDILQTGSRKSSAKKASQVEKETRASQDKAATIESEGRGHSQFTITPLSNDDSLDDDDDVDHSGEVEEELKGFNSRVRPDSPVLPFQFITEM